MLKGLIIFFALSAVFTKAKAQDTNWVYMDLGEVIVTGNATTGYDFVPGALTLIADLRASGHKVALVSNIPETWGASCAQKFASLKTFLDSRMNGPQTLDWTILDKVILPPFDRYRKPKTFMFMAALANACPGKSIFLGESADEIKTAKDLGFATFNTEVEGALPTLNQIDTLLNNEFSFPNPQDCGFDQLLNAQLEAQDVGVVQSCVHTPN
jgi:FMN phosphatase YigB (HAD superfamily)